MICRETNGKRKEEDTSIKGIFTYGLPGNERETNGKRTGNERTRTRLRRESSHMVCRETNGKRKEKHAAMNPGWSCHAITCPKNKALVTWPPSSLEPALSDHTLQYLSTALFLCQSLETSLRYDTFWIRARCSIQLKQEHYRKSS